MRIAITAVILVLLAMPVFAQEKSDDETAREFARVTELSSRLEATKQKAVEMSREQMDIMISSIQRNSAVPEEAMEEFRDAGKRFMDFVVDSWSPEEASMIYTNALMEGFSSEELKKAVEQFKSPEGQKQLKTIMEAEGRLNNYIMNKQNAATELGVAVFMEDIKSIARKYKDNPDYKSKNTR